MPTDAGLSMRIGPGSSWSMGGADHSRPLVGLGLDKRVAIIVDGHHVGIAGSGAVTPRFAAA